MKQYAAFIGPAFKIAPKFIKISIITNFTLSIRSKDTLHTVKNMFPVSFVLFFFFQIINKGVISPGGLMYWQYFCMWLVMVE